MEPESDAAGVGTEAAATERGPWAMALLAALVLVAAHAGLYVLLTASAQAKVRVLEEGRTAGEFANAADPGPQPRDDPAFGEWAEKRSIWEDTRARARHRRHISALGTALLVSVLIWIGLTGYLAFRAASAIERRAAARKRQTRRDLM